MSPFPFLLFLLLTFPISSTSTPQNDVASLLQFQTLSDPHGLLLPNWTSSSSPCTSPWLGVSCNSLLRVTSLSLPNLSLRGPLSPLSSLDQLRLLHLSHNRLSGPISPLLPSLPNLKLLYLDHNDLSGTLNLSPLRRLRRLDLSDNNLSGNLPNNLSDKLLTLRLHNNAFSGPLPSDLPISLSEFNVSDNDLSGSLPDSLVSRFGTTSFSGNEALCLKCQLTTSTPNFGTVHHRHRRVNLINALIASNVILVLAVLVFAVLCCRHRRKSKEGGGDEEKRRRSVESAKNNGGGESDSTSGTDKSRLVFFERKKEFELEDLLKASAEMLGKGSLGTVYRAVLEDGATVAVKRLKDANPCGRKEFEQYMDVIGRMRHTHIVRLRAYYYAREEKLLVYDYLPNGSLYSLLHGNRGPGRIPLDWTTRISLVLGSARGLARIHTEYNSSKIPHGNVKSTNILLDKNGVACISDFGLSLLLNPVHAITRLGGYRAPEQSETNRLSQEADVYSFGVLLLEVLTGKCPSQSPSPTAYPRIVEEEEESADLPKWVRSVVRDEWTAEVFDQELLRYKNIEEELVAMLHVGMACVVAQPEKRPTMVEVTKMIEEIRVELSPLGEEYEESRNSMSPSLATTEDAALGAY